MPLQSIIRFLCLHRKAAAAKITISKHIQLQSVIRPCLYVNNDGVESAYSRRFYEINTFWIVMVHNNVFQDESSTKRLCKVQNVWLHKKKKKAVAFITAQVFFCLSSRFGLARKEAQWVLGNLAADFKVRLDLSSSTSNTDCMSDETFTASDIGVTMQHNNNN